VCLRKNDPYSHRDADTLERTALLLLGEEQVGRRGSGAGGRGVRMKRRGGEMKG